MIDSHCHLDPQYFGADRGEVLARARAAGVEAFVCVGVGGGLAAPREAVALAETESDVFATVGVHPHDVAAMQDSDWTDLEELAPMLEGPTAIAFGKGDPAQTAKAVLDATRQYRVVRITGALLGNRAIDADGVTRLAALPAREVLLARLGGAMQAPVANLGGLLTANLRNLGSMLAQLAERKASEAEQRA